MGGVDGLDFMGYLGWDAFECWRCFGGFIYFLLRWLDLDWLVIEMVVGWITLIYLLCLITRQTMLPVGR